MADLRQVTYCGLYCRDEPGQTNSLAKTSGIYPRNACVLSGRGSMLLASVPFGTRPYRRKSLSTNIFVREDRDAVEAVYRERAPLGGDPVEKPELHRLNSLRIPASRQETPLPLSCPSRPSWCKNAKRNTQNGFQLYTITHLPHPVNPV